MKARLKDGKLDVMQAGMTDGQHDGWHCFHSEKTSYALHREDV
jgi:hypothetical protein